MPESWRQLSKSVIVVMSQYIFRGTERTCGGGFEAASSMYSRSALRRNISYQTLSEMNLHTNDFPWLLYSLVCDPPTNISMDLNTLYMLLRCSQFSNDYDLLLPENSNFRNPLSGLILHATGLR
jgi:hypothetical protein